MTMLRIIPFALVLLTAGCATAPGPTVAPRCDLQDDCFNRNTVRNFEVLDRDTIIVQAGPGRCPFVVELDGIVCNIGFVSRLVFFDRDDRICAADRAYLLTDPFMRIDSNDVCRIRNVRAVSDDELLERYASLGKIPPLPPVGPGDLQVSDGPESTAPENVSDEPDDTDSDHTDSDAADSAEAPGSSVD